MLAYFNWYIWEAAHETTGVTGVCSCLIEPFLANAGVRVSVFWAGERVGVNIPGDATAAPLPLVPVFWPRVPKSLEVCSSNAENR